jgi:transposase-like protein
MSSRFKKRKRFVSLPKHKRNDHYINLKNRIKRDSSIYGDLFWSDLVIDESEDSRWCDFYFLGLDKFTIWNATICMIWHTRRQSVC